MWTLKAAGEELRGMGVGELEAGLSPAVSPFTLGDHLETTLRLP